MMKYVLNSEFISMQRIQCIQKRSKQARRGSNDPLENSIPAKRRCDLETECELLWIESFLQNTHLYLGAYYRPPGSSIEDLSTYTTLIIEGIPVNTSSIMILGGDFSVVWKDHILNGQTREGRVLKDLQEEHNVHQIVITPTRKDNILDLILTDQPTSIVHLEVVDSLPGCDHDAINFTVNIYIAKPRVPPHKRRTYNFKRGKLW